MVSSPSDFTSEIVLNTEHVSSLVGVADLHDIEDASIELVTVETLSLAPQAGVSFLFLALEVADVDSSGDDSGVESALEQTSNWHVSDSADDTVAKTSGCNVVGNIDNYVDEPAVVGDQDLSTVGSSDFDVVTLLEDSTTVGEISVSTFDGSEVLSVQDNLVTDVNLDDINTVGADSGSDDTGPGSTVEALESGVD